MSHTEPYELLAEAVVRQAAVDYVNALRELAVCPRRTEAILQKDDAERFFRSAWFGTLCRADAEMLRKALDREGGAKPDEPQSPDTLLPFLYNYLSRTGRRERRSA